MSFTTPKDALQRIQIGQSFAEYDLVREDPYVFVSTAASLVATQGKVKEDHINEIFDRTVRAVG
jgi:hypothetical protein